MHAVSHTFAHRAQPAARTRARWQPYSTIPVSGKSPLNYLVTPASSISSSPPPTRMSENERPPSQPSQVILSRDPQKTRYIVNLVDQAVKCLTEIWQPTNIPPEFLSSSCNSHMLGDSTESIAAGLASIPSSSRLTPPMSPTSPLSRQYPAPPLHLPAGSHRTAPSTPQINLVTLKGFVHEVLRRSRTSGTVLQAALCYLEAIRSKVPELAKQEKSGSHSPVDTDPMSRIIKAEDLPIAEDEEEDAAFAAIINIDNCIPTPTSLHDEVPLGSTESGAEMDTTSPNHDEKTSKSKSPSPSLPPLPSLPSPLLCPKRAFLASLILASKFTQDRCYSNRAWAKLAGLPPREIGRCERALGDALQWRLWVGKKTQTVSPNGRPVVRCRSEGDLVPVSKESAMIGRPTLGRPASSAQRGLRRWSTLPADAFSSKESAENLNSEFGCSADSAALLRAPSVFPLHASPHPYSTRFEDTPPTPTLDSPSSSESDSSAGERTVQMTFLDATSPPNQHGKPFSGYLENMPSNNGVFATAPHVVGGDPVLYRPHALAYQNVPLSRTVAPDSLALTVDAVQLY